MRSSRGNWGCLVCRRGNIALHNCLPGGCSEEGVDLKCQVIGCEQMASSCTKGGLDLIYRKSLFMERVVKHGNGPPRRSGDVPVPGGI